MQDYNTMRLKQEQDYERSRDPFQYGRQVAQRRYSEIMAGLDAQRRSTQQTYGDMYQAAKQRAVASQAAGGPTLSGGMGQQRRDYVSALEMQELSKIGTARQQAMADLFTQQQAAFSDAQLEGQQATQMDLQNKQAMLGLAQQKQEILNNNDLTIEEKTEQLTALGISPEGETISGEKTSFEKALPWAAGGGLSAAAIATYMGIKGITVAAGVKGLLAIGSAALPVIGVGLVAAVVIGLAAWAITAAID